MKRILLTLLIVVGVVLFVRIFAFTSCTIPSNGMENTLYQGDRVLVNQQRTKPSWEHPLVRKARLSWKRKFWYLCFRKAEVSCFATWNTYL